MGGVYEAIRVANLTITPGITPEGRRKREGMVSLSRWMRYRRYFESAQNPCCYFHTHWWRMASDDSGDAVICPRDYSIYVSASGNIPIGTPRNRRYTATYTMYTKANMNKSIGQRNMYRPMEWSDKNTARFRSCFAIDRFRLHPSSMKLIISDIHIFQCVGVFYNLQI